VTQRPKRFLADQSSIARRWAGPLYRWQRTELRRLDLFRVRVEPLEEYFYAATFGDLLDVFIIFTQVGRLDNAVQVNLNEIQARRGASNAPAGKLSSACNRYPHLDPVFLMVVRERDALIVLLNAIHRHAHLAIPGRRLQDRDVVDGLPIAVVDLEPLPLRRQARRETQFVHFKSEPQE